MMSIFNPQTVIGESSFFKGFTDWHCHILPGVDDGFKNIEDSLKILDLYEASGFSMVWLTPHVMEDIPNTTDDLRIRFEALKSAYKGNLNLQLASENMMDNLFDERLEAGDLLPYDGRRLLVETSYFNPPYNMHGILEKVKSKGFYPVLAHPERYMYMDMEEYKTIKSMGVLFQLNIPSLYGAYGPDVQSKAEKLLSLGMYDLSATDLHRISSFLHMKEARLKKKILNIIPR